MLDTKAVAWCCRRAYTPPRWISSVWVPCSTMRPDSITTTRSACSMVVRRCATTRVVRPCMRRCRASCTRRSDSLSSAEVASSRIRMGAFLYTARAMASRWRWPPESWAALCPTMLSMPMGRRSMKVPRLAASSAACTRARSSSLPRATLAAMVSLSITTSWLTMAIWARRRSRGQSSRATSSSSTRPLDGSTKRGSRLTSVVLPDPDGPTKATTSPGAMCRSMSSSAAAAVSVRPSAWATLAPVGMVVNRGEVGMRASRSAACAA